MQYCEGCAVQRSHTISTYEDVQHRSGTPSVRRRHIISIEEGVQYRSVTPLMEKTHIFSTDAKCAVLITLYMTEMLMTESRFLYEIDVLVVLNCTASSILMM